MYGPDLAYIHDSGFGDFAREAAPELIRLLHAQAIRSGHVVEAGCGSGILAKRLVDAGYRVTGFDRSAAMIRLARARASGAAFHVRSIEDIRVPTCDAVIAIGEVVSYVGAWRTVQRFFHRVHGALASDGLFIFDFIESGEERTYPDRRHEGETWALVARAELGDRGRVLTRRMTIFRDVRGMRRKTREVHRVRIHPRAMIAAALRSAGFAVDMRRSYGRCRLMPGDVAVIARRR